MSDLHQYEIHHYWTDQTSGGCRKKIRLVWAYTVQEACFQLDLELKHQNDRYYAIVSAGPVTKAATYGTSEGMKPFHIHFHVCTKC